VSVDEMKKRIQTALPDADPTQVFKTLAKKIAQHNAQSDNKNFSPELSKAFAMALSTLSLDSHARLADTTTDKLAPLAITVAQKLISEYRCETAAEKTLAEIVANAYVRVLRYSEALNDVYGRGTTSPEINKYISVTSMELDRANRQYLTALSTLKSFKQPSVNVTFKANTAFVAQHQEINAMPNPKPEERTNEAQ
jgi:hypothetical protein